ncbi:4-hydroxyphenylpyruvate dioxygenase [Suhomyces tanzawaensis NRRL Y-17324]|uniref:4-hydroxyphenylpyruvate dioxygenase n=1 Tax=Suhomyces tanzawaensis NRRL Y-17324 TaxID=984487 RepID=A0A1E4SME5_9ASCO|nr:4-hydroxyphenylpyruvate dioxygenase [Suhomyces tanzawaensis NRRL Y-17324]ODV80683.1 4-hydroxyphenylpyruvate dioxygenase [Suhomyces tanzawaensis NRRL Y-17324]
MDLGYHRTPVEPGELLEISESADPIFHSELPFFPASSDPLFDSSVSELLNDGHSSYKYSPDGFIRFHSLKLCTSNAKQMSKYFQVVFGFKEIAYKGLENDSRLVGSHVIRNGGVVLELVNTIETVEDENILKFPYFEKDLERLNQINNNQYANEYKVTTDDLVFDFVNSKINGLSKSSVNNSLHFGRKISMKVLSSRAFKNSINEYNKLILETINNSETVYNDIMECTLIQKFLKTHGEGVMDIAFLVEDVEYSFQKAIKSGAGITRAPRLLADEMGAVKIATISVPNTDILHTLIQNIDYKGPYLPGYSKGGTSDPLFAIYLKMLPPIKLQNIDHCVENYSWNQMMEQACFYARMFGFRKYWSVDEQDVSTGNSALRSIVMASANGKIKMPINEPAEGKMRGQIEEFHDFNGGPGIQHFALKTNDIVGTVSGLLTRGIEFNSTSSSFYESLRLRLRKDDIILFEDLDVLERLNILVDYDTNTRNKKTKRCNYILQIFTKPLHDRPTLFIEIIQRRHHNGFGKGTFKGLFESIEEQQMLRGTLVPSD